MILGTLKPGATYVYERVDDRIYARELGKTKRSLVGVTANDNVANREYNSNVNGMLAMCKTDPAMKELLDQLFVLYNLKKKNDTLFCQ